MADPLVSTRLNRKVARQLDVLARRKGQRRSAVLREVIERGLAVTRLEDAVSAYKEGRVSYGRAAELSGLSLWEFLDVLRVRRIGVPLTYTLEDVEVDVAQAKGEA